MTAVIVFGTVKIAEADPGWLLDLGVGLVICATALPRRWNRARTAATGLVLFAAAGLATALCNLLPGPLYGGALIGLLVLGIVAVRRLPPRPVAGPAPPEPLTARDNRDCQCQRLVRPSHPVCADRRDRLGRSIHRRLAALP